MSDVKLFQTGDGGNITINTNQDVELTGGFETDFYLSLFGGNQDDDGSVGNKNNWWGNLTENDPIYQFRSKTQNLLVSLPLVSGNLRRIEDAAKYDIQSYIDIGSVDSIDVTVSIIGKRAVSIKIDAFVDGNNISITFLANWQSMESEYLTV